MEFRRHLFMAGQALYMSQNCLNFTLTIAYVILKENSYCKFNEMPYALVNMKVKSKSKSFSLQNHNGRCEKQ